MEFFLVYPNTSSDFSVTLYDISHTHARMHAHNKTHACYSHALTHTLSTHKSLKSFLALKIGRYTKKLKTERIRITDKADKRLKE